MRFRIEQSHGFAVVIAENEVLRLKVVPQLGAKLVSLCSLPSGREWLWRPPGELRLWRNNPGDAFSRSTLIGLDECFPTVEACVVAGRRHADHGDAWSAEWALDQAQLAGGAIVTDLVLRGSRWRLRRAIYLDRSCICIDYRLENHSDEAAPYVWAMHPLLSVRSGDRLWLPPEIAAVTVASSTNVSLRRGAICSWPVIAPGADLHRILSGLEGQSVKFFAGPLREGWAQLTNDDSTDRLEFRWSAAQLPFVGVWITRGGWNRFHHFAIEPTNTPHDSLAAAAANRGPEIMVGPGERREWSVVLDVAPHSLSSGAATWSEPEI